MTLIARISLVAVALALVLAAAACGGDGGGDESSEGGSTTIGGVQTESHGAKDVSGATGKVEVEMDDNYFEPTILEGTPGQQVELELKNEGNAAHTLTIAEQNVDAEVQPGDETEVEVTFPQSGQLTFVCKFHQSSGMVGALQASK